MQCIYLRAVLLVAQLPRALPIRKQILAAMIQHLVSLDVEIQWQDIAFTPGRRYRLPSTPHPTKLYCSYSMEHYPGFVLPPPCRMFDKDRLKLQEHLYDYALQFLEKPCCAQISIPSQLLYASLVMANYSRGQECPQGQSFHYAAKMMYNTAILVQG